jgi:hypothetical protein
MYTNTDDHPQHDLEDSGLVAQTDEEGECSGLRSDEPHQQQSDSPKEKAPRRKNCPHCDCPLDDENKGYTTFDLIKHTAIGSVVKQLNTSLDRVHRALSPTERLDTVYASIEELPSLLRGKKNYDDDLLAALSIPEELSGLDSRLARTYKEVRETVNRRKQEMRRLLSRQYMGKVDIYLQRPEWRSLYRESLQIFLTALNH